MKLFSNSKPIIPTSQIRREFAGLDHDAPTNVGRSLPAPAGAPAAASCGAPPTAAELDALRRPARALPPSIVIDDPATGFCWLLLLMLPQLLTAQVVESDSFGSIIGYQWSGDAASPRPDPMLMSLTEWLADTLPPDRDSLGAVEWRERPAVPSMRSFTVYRPIRPVMEWMESRVVFHTIDSSDNTDRHVSFTMDRQGDSIGHALTVVGSGVAYTVPLPDSTAMVIIRESVYKTLDVQREQLEVLRWKVRFYERHFGTLTGTPDDPCSTFEKAINAPPMERCTIQGSGTPKMIMPEPSTIKLRRQ